MQELQKGVQDRILKQYMEFWDDPSLRDVSQDTGIQLTRVFRLMNGSPMKLEEYLIFRGKIAEKMKLECAFSALARECEDQLSIKTLLELSQFLKRALKQNKMKNSNIKILRTA